MKQTTFRNALAAIAAAAVTAGCAGGGGTAMMPPAATTPQPRGTASVVIVIPDPKAPASAKRRPSYISASTQSVGISIYPAGTTPPAQPTSTVDLTPASPNCTGSPRTCTITLGAPLGNDAFRFTLYDLPAGAGKVLSTGTVTATITTTPQPLDITLDGVPVSVALALSQSTVFAHVPSSVTLTVNASDADGNLIIAPGNYTTPIALQVTGPAGVTLSSNTVTGPAASSVTVSYDGTAPPGATFTFSATGPPNGQVLPAPKLTVTTGVVANYSQGIGASSGLQGIVKASDGNFWFCEWFNGTGGLTPPSRIGVITHQGNVIHQYTLPTGARRLDRPWVIINGPASDPVSKVWVLAEFGLGSLRVSDGAITEYPFASGLAIGAQPGETVGPDNAIWFTQGIEDQAWFGRLDPTLPPNTVAANGPLNPKEFTGLTPAGRRPTGIATGSDGNIWMTENADPGRIARYNLNPPAGVTAGTVTEFAIPTLNSRPTGIISAPDGSLWFIESALNKLARFDPRTATPASPGIVEHANATSAAGTSPRANASSIVLQPDGTIWFVEDARDGYIGRLDPLTATITQYPVTGVDPQWIAADTPGSIWFTEDFNTPDRIGQLVY